MADDDPRNKADLIERIHSHWDRLQALVGRLSPNEMERPLGDGWSAKVHLGHIGAWEQSLMALIRGQDRSTGMGVSPEQYAAGDMDATNGIIAAGAQSLPLDDVRNRSNETHAELLAMLESMSEDDLSKPYSHYQPNDPPYNPEPVVGWIAGNTFDHYDEHIG